MKPIKVLRPSHSDHHRQDIFKVILRKGHRAERTKSDRQFKMAYKRGKAKDIELLSAKEQEEKEKKEKSVIHPAFRIYKISNLDSNVQI